MKAKHIGILFAVLLACWGCDDNTGALGISMLPDSDGLSVRTKTFPVTTRSILAKKIYARTSIGYVGKFTDPDPDGFGDYEASFLTELNCTDGYTFPAVYDDATHTGYMAGDTVVSIQLVVYYSSWFGDSLNACRMKVAELDKRLEKNRYTDIDPEKYCSQTASRPGNSIESPYFNLYKAYTAYDTSVPDSVRNSTDSYGNSNYYPNITFPLDTVYGNEILHLNRTHPEYFKNSDAFIDNVLKGVYIKTDYGDGTILYVDRVDLQMQFRFHHVDSLGVKLKKADGTDSLYYSMATVFASTKEVIQANQFKNSKQLEAKYKETGHTYLKSPAGIFTEATLPYEEIYNELPNDTLNAVKLTFTNYHEDNSKYKFSMSAPSTVLLVREKDMDTFFEENQLTDNVTSFIATHNGVATNQYTFSNIARLVSTCINELKAAKAAAGSSWDAARWKAENPEWDKIVIIPVSITYDSTSSSSTMTGIEHDLKPAYARLKGGDPEQGGTSLQVEVTYTSFNE